MEKTSSKPRLLSWNPRAGVDGVWCAPACGRGCTRNMYDDAVARADALAKRLGEGWVPHVWENLGWYYKAVSSCGRLKVHGDRAGGYSAFLGYDTVSGRWAEHGRTPIAACRAVLARGRQELAEVAGLVDGFSFGGAK